MKRFNTLIVIFTLGFAYFAFAQREPLPLFTTATDDKAYIVLVGVPRDMEGFNVYRKGPDDREFVLLNQMPISAVVDPAAARQILGDDYPWVARALRAEDEFEVLRRLGSDAGVSTVLSLASLRVAQVTGRLFIDKNVEHKKTYHYRIEFLDYSGEILGTAERDISISTSKPRAPQKVESVSGDSEVKVSWDYPEYSGDPNDIVVGFNIYRKSATGDFEKINKARIMRQEDLKYRTDIAVENNQSYTYYVTAIDFIGRESSPSTYVTATPKDLTPPAFPQGLDAISEEGRILIAWQMNLELDVSHYDVYKSLDMDEGFEKINLEPIPGDLPHYIDEDVYSGPTYYYKVKAIDLVGNESDFSNVISGHPADSTAPAPPDSVIAKVVDHFVYLNWIAPDEKDLLGYYIYRRRSDLEFLRIVGPPLPKDSLHFEDTGYKLKGLWPGKTFEYGLSSVDRVYNESPMSVVTVTIPDDEPPTPPLDSYARSTSEGLVEITWQPSMALDVVKYRVFRGQHELEPTILIETNDSTYAAVDSTVKRGTSYSYQVAAVDEWGNESPKTEKTTVVPRDLVAPPAPENVKVIVDTNGVSIMWDPVQVNDLVGYNIYRSDIPTGIVEKLNLTPITYTSYFDPLGKPGLYYRISSLDTSGHENKEGEAVESVQAER